MTAIVPVRDLKDTNRISELCNMVIMSMTYYEEAIGRNAVYAKFEEARADIASDRVKPLRKALASQRAKFNVHA